MTTQIRPIFHVGSRARGSGRRTRTFPPVVATGTGITAIASNGNGTLTELGVSTLVLDMAGDSGITQTGGAISQWDSAVGTASFTQATPADQPQLITAGLNGLDVVEARNASTDFLAGNAAAISLIEGASVVTMISVFNYVSSPSPPNPITISWFHTPTDRELALNGNSGVGLYYYDGAADTLATGVTDPTQNTWNITVLQVDLASDTYRLAVNGIGSPTAHAFTAASIGASDRVHLVDNGFRTFRLAQLRVWIGAMDGTALTTEYNTLATKWGLPTI